MCVGWVAVLSPDIRNWPVFKREGLTSSWAEWPSLVGKSVLFDLTDNFNTLNKSLQGKDQLVPQLYAHMKAFCVNAFMCICLFETHYVTLIHTSPRCLKSNALFQRPTFLLKIGSMCLWSHFSWQNSVSASKIFLPLRKKSSCSWLPSWWMQKKWKRVCN